MTNQNDNTYIAKLEQDLLELPGKPYSRCCLCNKLGVTHNMHPKYSATSEFFCCDECENKTDRLFGEYHEERA